VALAAGLFALSLAPLDWLHDRDHLWPLNPRTPSTYDVLFQSVSGFADPGWFAAVRASAWRLLGGIVLVAVLGGLLARERSREAWRRVGWLAAALVVWWAIERFPLDASATPVRLSVLVSFLACGLALASPALEGRPYLVAVGVFAGLAGLRAAVSPFMTGPYDGPAHFAAAASWIVLLLILAPPLLWPEPGSRAATLTRGTLAAVLGLSFWWDAAGNAAALRYPWKQAVSTPAGPVYVEFGVANLLREVGRHVAAGDRILVVPEINAVDALFGARSISPVLHHLPGFFDARMETDLVRRLEAAPPSTVVLFARATPELELAPFGEGFGVGIWDWCLRHGRVVYSSPRGKVLTLGGGSERSARPVAPEAHR
jgi:hypothetical protein